jgi:hypothetical protein
LAFPSALDSDSLPFLNFHHLSKLQSRFSNKCFFIFLDHTKEFRRKIFWLISQFSLEFLILTIDLTLQKSQFPLHSVSCIRSPLFSSRKTFFGHNAPIKRFSLWKIEPD